MSHSRRSVLRAGAGLLGAGTATGLAGCTDAGDAGGGSGTEFDAGYASFFTLEDWANRVAGDHATFEDPVDVGQLGHGWEPDGNLLAEVASTDAFVYLDSPEFPWAQDVAQTLRNDYDDVAVIDALADLDDELLDWNHEEGSDEEGSTEERATEEDHDHEDEETHDHDEEEHDGGSDPHVWVDPVFAGTMVDTIADGLAAADPDNADDYTANADAYNADLDEVDAAFESLVAEADRDVAVIAGHDSFQYLEARYGFSLHSPVGVSPQNEPSQSDIADTIDLVNERGIDVVLYDRFESPNLAETIVENSDATETMVVSPAGGTTAEWNDAGYGYFDQMLEINVPAFRRALGAE